MSAFSESRVSHGGALREAMARHGGAAEDWLDLSTGISPRSFPLPAIDGETWRRLPDPDLVREVARAATRHYGGGSIPAIAPGSQAAIQHLPALADLAMPGASSVAILAPTYGEYEAAFRRHGFAVGQVGSLAEAIEADAVVLANPNNPDGRRSAPSEIEAFAVARKGRLTVIDEAFADMHPDLSVAALAGSVPGLVVLRSFGKFFGMAGLRLGFVFGESRLTSALSARLGPWAVSGPALAVAGHAFGNPDLVAAQERAIRAAHALTRDAAVSAGCSLVGETALFLLVAARTGARWRDWLAARHILTRAFDHSPDVLRIGLVANAREAERLRGALSAVADG